LTPEGEENKEFDAKVQLLYRSLIPRPLVKTYMLSRLYGSAGMLLGYRDANGFDKPANPTDKIGYLFAIPHKWINARVGETDSSCLSFHAPLLSLHTGQNLCPGP
jgi:hypothetical protein